MEWRKEERKWEKRELASTSNEKLLFTSLPIGAFHERILTCEVVKRKTTYNKVNKVKEAIKSVLFMRVFCLYIFCFKQ
jgi:hypothetical protein